MSVFPKHPSAGLYQADLELRDRAGTPFLLRVRYVYTARTLPLAAVEAFRLAVGVAAQLPTQADLEEVDHICATFAATVV